MNGVEVVLEVFLLIAIMFNSSNNVELVTQLSTFGSLPVCIEGREYFRDKAVQDGKASFIKLKCVRVDISDVYTPI